MSHDRNKPEEAEGEHNPVKSVAMALRSAAVHDRERADAMKRFADLLDDPKGEC
jgi:hypothetical protein